MTFYLKYRPQNIEELDLTDVREQLLKIVKSEEMPHAFLFAGPRGAGKTSAARILAKAVNCEKPNKSGEPCNECSQCEQINKGASLDIVELDAASHRGVEDIRSLRDAVSLAPASAKKKVYIIDEAHMLTSEASNALLKTLEEPPAHVLFVLATTAPDKLLDTIRSRCLTLVFRKAGGGEVVESLKKVVEGEKLEVEKGVLEEIAKRVDGSFREAHKTLEQLALGKKKVTLKDLDSARIFSSNTVDKFIEALAEKNSKAALEILLKANEDGVNMKNFSVVVVTKLREALLVNLGVGSGEGIEGLELEELQTLAELFSEASAKIAGAVIPSLPLELAVVRWGQNREQSPSSKKKLEVGNEKLDNEAGSEKTQKKSHIQSSNPTSHLAHPISPTDLEEKWKEILALLRPKNFSIEALLRAARPAGFDGKNLQVEVFYGFHKERLEKDQYRKVVEEVACGVLGASDLRLVCVLSTTKKRALDVANVVESVDEDIVKIAEEIFTESGSEAENFPN